MESLSTGSGQNKTTVCPVCGCPNNVDSEFCDSCGNPLGNPVNKDSEMERVPEIALGYATNIRNEKESKDSFVVLDMNSFFVSRQQRRVLCSIVRGLEKVVEGREIVNDFLSDIWSRNSAQEYEKRLSDLQKELYKKYSEAQIAGMVKDTENGYLFSVLDSRRLTYISQGSCTTYVLNAKELKELPKGSGVSPTLTSNLLNGGDHFCLCSHDLSHLLGTKELSGTLTKAENPRVACTELLRKAADKKSDIGFSVVVGRIIDTR